MTEYVIGMDASNRAKSALRWAIDHARPEDRIVAVNVWQPPAVLGPEVAMLDPGLLEAEAKQLLVSAVDEVTAAVGEGAPAVEIEVLQGHPGRALLDRAELGDILVVGARGHGGFTGLLLGSTSTYVVHHASCPVVVVPDDRGA